MSDINQSKSAKQALFYSRTHQFLHETIFRTHDCLRGIMFTLSFYHQTSIIKRESVEESSTQRI